MQKIIKQALHSLVHQHSHSRITKYIVKKWPKWVCAVLSEHVLKIWMDKPENGLNFRHNLFCDRCNKIFDMLPVSVYYYDHPGYKMKVRMWLASHLINTAEIDRLMADLSKFREQIQPLRGRNKRKRKKQG